MKRRIAIFLSAVLLCLAFAGCEAETQPSNKLWVITDLGWLWTAGGDMALEESRAEADFQAILKYFGGLPEDLEVELEILPVDEADLNARLTRLKTEILAGGGPDVFLLTCNDQGWMGQERLFPNPEKAMHSGFFLPLDEYIENAQFMEWDKLTPAVMAAGRTEEGQMLLPFRYETNAIIAKKEFLGEKVPENWDEAVNGDNPVFQKGYAWLASWYFPNVFPKIADNKAKELLITKEELQHRVEQALSCPEFGWENESFTASPLGPAFTDGEGRNLWETDLDNTVFLPMRNTEGGYSAYVTYYGAVNRNTKLPQEAFTVLDMFLTKQVLRGEVFGGTVGDRMHWRGIYLFSNLHAIPVHEELFLGAQNSVDSISASEEAFRNFDSLRKEITDVYFPSNIDRTIDEMYVECYYSGYQGKGSSEEVKKLVSQAYDRIWLMLGES